MASIDPEKVLETVRRHYSKLAQKGCRNDTNRGNQSCCGGSTNLEEIGRLVGYSPDELRSVAAGANMGLGCGNPHAFGRIKEGDVVLDLGSGAGFDCFIAAKAVGDSGRVIGVDMTPQMVKRANKNAKAMGSHNLEFRLGQIEQLPVESDSIEVIISNCVINLSPDKTSVFREAYRVLKPGGRLAVSDVVATATLPELLRKDLELLTGCIAGAEPIESLKQILETVGFEEVRILPMDESRLLIDHWVPGAGVENYVASARIEAIKPVKKGGPS